MRMMPMLKVKESKTPVSDNQNRSLKEPVKDNNFKSEYENIARDVKEQGKISSKKTEQIKDVSDKIPTVHKEKNKKDSSTDINIIKQVVSKKIHVKGSEAIKSHKTKSKKQTLKDVENKSVAESKSKNRIKETDKDTLNQSIASLMSSEKPSPQKAEEKVSTEKEAKVTNDTAVKEHTKENIAINNLINSKDSKLNSSIKDKDQVDKKDKNKKSESKVKVADFRNELKKAGETRNVELAKKNTEQNISASTEVKLENSEQIEGGAEKTIVLGTTEITAEGEGGKAQAPVIKEASVLLKQQLKDFGNNEIVKQSRFILKDNNVGEIKLILKPEALGQVKINLNFNENSLAGQIVVENNSVKEVFQENLNQLSKALEKEGFDSAKLDVSLNDKKGSDSQNKGENKQYFSERLKRFDNNGQVVRYGMPTAGINLTA